MARVEKLEARIEEMRPLMDGKKKTIIRATAHALAAFWPDFVSDCVRASGDKGGGGNRDRRPRVRGPKRT